MSSSWEDFDDLPNKTKGSESTRTAKPGKSYGPRGEPEKKEQTFDKNPQELFDCDWGFGYQPTDDDDSYGESTETESKRFILIYENYLRDKKSIVSNTQNHKMFSHDSKAVLRSWLTNEGHDLDPKVHQVDGGKYTCNLVLPVNQHDFTIASDIHKTGEEAIGEVCLTACRLLDEAAILFRQHSKSMATHNKDTRKRTYEADEDDELGSDHASISKRPKDSKLNVHTYESLMTRWKELNMLILKSKAELVKLDLDINKHLATAKNVEGKTTDDEKNESANTDLDDEVDPLDEYMSNLEKRTLKTVSTRDEKIEKSRLKTQIAIHEREQKEVSRLIEIAKPKFNLDKIKQTLKKS